MTVRWNPGPYTAKLRQAALAQVQQTTEAVVAKGDELIASPPKSGRVYRRRGVVHRASAPGEAPATDTGALIQSGAALYPGSSNPDVILGVANWSIDYAQALEFGTEKMEPRPFARPALDEIGPTMPAGLAAKIGGVR